MYAMMHENLTGVVWLPISKEDYSELRTLLKTQDVLVTGNYEDGGSFDLPTYILSTDIEFRALFDRNILSLLVHLATGEPLSGDEEAKRHGRVACACIAFCILAKILIEPSMALYEYASTQGNTAAQNDYINFRAIDNVDPLIFIDIALGRSDRIPAEHLLEIQKNLAISEDISPEPNFERRLRKWKLNYFYVLKMAALKRSGLSPLESALEFQRWQFEDSFCNAVASIYCLAAVSHQPPKGKMLKGINSNNSITLKQGLENAAWDIYLIQRFKDFMILPHCPSWSLWTFDIAVREITRMLFVRDGEDQEKQLNRFYSQCWGRDSSILFESYSRHSIEANLGSDARERAIEKAFDRIDQDILALENNLGF